MKKFLLIAAMALLPLASCKTHPPDTVTEKETVLTKSTKDSTHVQETITQQVVQGANVTARINLDSIRRAIESGLVPAGGYVSKKDQNGNELRFFVDAYGNLVAQCEGKDQLIQSLQKIIYQKESEDSTRTENAVVKPTAAVLSPFEQTLLNGLKVIMWFGIILTVLIVIFALYKIYRAWQLRKHGA